MKYNLKRKCEMELEQIQKKYGKVPLKFYRYYLKGDKSC